MFKRGGILSLLNLAITSFLKQKKEDSLKKILLQKLSVEVKNIPLLLLGFFVFSMTVSIGFFCFIFGSIIYYQSQEAFMNIWITTSLLLFSVAALIFVPVYLYINEKSREVQKIKMVSQPSSLFLQPLLPLIKEIQRENKQFVNDYLYTKTDTVKYINARKIN